MALWSNASPNASPFFTKISKKTFYVLGSARGSGMRFQARKGSPWMPSSRAGSDLAGVLFLILWNFSLLCNCYRFLLLKKKKRREPVWSRRAAASRRESCRSRDCKVQACHPVPSKKSEPTEARAGLPGEIGRSQRSRWRILSLRSAAESHDQRSASPSLEGLPRRLCSLAVAAAAQVAAVHQPPPFICSR